ncbi:hypothetical protein ABT336_12035 [Micromonospora sp. NPDC000207]|uniref:hypothetical protein n=1 Tax=Micromonospora sp. NPDC000207 TaxID=3154246 RepID=UPI00332ACE98
MTQHDLTGADYAVIHGIAAVIRQHRNGTETDVLGAAIAAYINGDNCGCPGCGEAVADIIRRVNPDQAMGAGNLAEAIWLDLNA